MTLKELKIGEIFQFEFDKGTKWVYKKIDQEYAKLVNAPNTEKGLIGTNCPLHRCYEYTVKIIPGC